MKLSRPQYNHVRFDSDPAIAIGYHVIPCDMEYTGYICPPTEDDNYFVIGARFRVVFYIDNVGNEVAGYLGEVQSVVLESSNPDEDKDMLLYFCKNTFQSFVEHLRNKLPHIDVNFIPPPSYREVVEAWGENLVKSGLY